MNTRMMALVLVTLAGRVLAQGPTGEAQKVDLRWRAEPGRKVLVERSGVETRTVEVTLGDQPPATTVEQFSEYQSFVDCNIAIPDPGKTRYDRTFLRWEVTTPGGLVRSEIAGHKVIYHFTGGKRRHAAWATEGVNLVGDTRLALEIAPSVCGKLPLPETARVGEEVSVELVGYLPLLFIGWDAPSKRATARLKVGIPTGDLVSLAGPLEVRIDSELRSVGPEFEKVDQTRQGNLEIQWDHKKGFYRKITFDGTSVLKQASQDGKRSVKTSSTYHIDLKAIDGKPAEDAEKAGSVRR